MAARLFTDAEEAEIEKIYRVGGFNSYAIARQYHAQAQTILRVIVRAGGRVRTREETHALVRARGGMDVFGARFVEAEEVEIRKLYCSRNL